MSQPNKPPVHQSLQHLMDQADQMLKQQPKLMAKGTVTSSTLQGTGGSTTTPVAPTTPAPSPWQHFLTWLGIGTPAAAQTQAKQLSGGGAYLAGGGKRQAQQANDVINAAGGK